MTLRFCDSFSAYGADQLALRYDVLGSLFAIGGCYIGTGRFGGGLVVRSYAVRTFDYQATWTVGMAIKGGQVDGYTRLITLVDGTTVQCEVGLNSLGQLYVGRGWTSVYTDCTSTPGYAPLAYLATKPTVFDTTGWHYIELSATIGASGSYNVQVDGLSVLSASGVNTQASGTAGANRVQIGWNNGLSVDDLYICDGQGSAPWNGLLGDVRVQALLPAADGDLAQFVPSTGTSHFALVDEVPPNGDTDYVSSANAGDVDLYQMGDVAAVSGDVLGVQVLASARKDDAGTRTLTPVIKTGGVEHDGTAVALGTSYAYVSQIWEQNPETSAPWTITEANALQAGVKAG